MSDLAVIELRGKRVLTTQQLAEIYGTTNRRISENYNSNKCRYQLGKHYIVLEGDELKAFGDQYGNSVSVNRVSKLYLWPEKGALMQAKSLNTDKAWEAYEKLVDDYYKIKTESLSTNQLSPELQMFKNIWDGLAKKEIEDAKRDEEIKGLRTTVTVIKDTFLQRDDDWRKSVNRMLNEAARRASGDYQQVRRTSYLKLEERARCNLNIRLTNLKDRLEDSGATATKVKEANKLSVIESDARLKEIYTTIVKELSIGSLV